MSSPERALEAQGLLRDRLSRPAYVRFMDGFQDSLRKKNAGPTVMSARGENAPAGWEFCQREQRRLSLADPYFVAAEMMPLVRWAAAGLSDIDRFSLDLWPSPFGFVYFDEPLISTDAWGRKMVHKAVSWGRVEANYAKTYGEDGSVTARPMVGGGVTGVLVVTYTDSHDMRDEWTASMSDAERDGLRDLLGPLQVVHMDFIADDQRVGPERVMPPERYAQYAVGDLTLTEADNSERFLLALLMMLNQTVTSVETHEVDRRSARRFRRMGLPGRVTVVRLRRHKDANRHEGETLVEWAHRWIVKGHWRNQPYSDGRGGTVHRRIWIAPFVKGPENKPLKQSDKVYALVR